MAHSSAGSCVPRYHDRAKVLSAECWVPNTDKPWNVEEKEKKICWICISFFRVIVLTFVWIVLPLFSCRWFRCLCNFCRFETSWLLSHWDWDVFEDAFHWSAKCTPKQSYKNSQNRGRRERERERQSERTKWKQSQADWLRQDENELQEEDVKNIVKSNENYNNNKKTGNNFSPLSIFIVCSQLWCRRIAHMQHAPVDTNRKTYTHTH